MASEEAQIRSTYDWSRALQSSSDYLLFYGITNGSLCFMWNMTVAMICNSSYRIIILYFFLIYFAEHVPPSPSPKVSAPYGISKS